GFSSQPLECTIFRQITFSQARETPLFLILFFRAEDCQRPKIFQISLNRRLFCRQNINFSENKTNMVPFGFVSKRMHEIKPSFKSLLLITVLLLTGDWMGQAAPSGNVEKIILPFHETFSSPQ